MLLSFLSFLILLQMFVSFLALKSFSRSVHWDQMIVCQKLLKGSVWGDGTRETWNMSSPLPLIACGPLCVSCYISCWNSRCISSLSPSVSECPVDISSVNDCAGPDSNEPIKIRRILFVTVSSSNQIRYLVTPNAFFFHLTYNKPYYIYCVTFISVVFFLSISRFGFKKIAI